MYYYQYYILYLFTSSQWLLLFVDNKSVCRFILEIKHWNKRNKTNMKMKNVIYKEENGF